MARFVSCQPQSVAVDPPGIIVTDAISLDSVRAIADSVGSQELFQRTSQPSAVLTDFFGVQPLEPYTLDQIMTDLVPGLATVLERGASRTTLRIRNGPAVVFQANARLIVNGNVVEKSYARVVIEQPSTYPHEPELFRTALIEAGLSDRYLTRNPYHELELQVAAHLADPTTVEPVEVSADTSGFGDHEHAIILVGETHGGTERYEQALTLLALPAVSWIAIEMVPENLQSSLDTFQAHPPGSALHEAARDSLVHFFSANWNTRGHEITARPDENPYFQMILAARRLGKRVIAMDTQSDYILFRFGEFPLGAAVRDATWAANVPSTGRGVVYGGSSHFSQSRRPNMLTYLRSRDEAIQIIQPRTEE